MGDEFSMNRRKQSKKQNKIILVVMDKYHIYHTRYSTNTKTY